MRRRLLLLLAFLLLASCARETKRPNVLLITLDTFRADRVGPRTPAISAVASRGIRFDDAMSAAPLTLPSHATILSGLLPPHHGLRNNGSGVFPANRETLATVAATRWRIARSRGSRRTTRARSSPGTTTATRWTSRRVRST